MCSSWLTRLPDKFGSYQAEEDRDHLEICLGNFNHSKTQNSFRYYITDNVEMKILESTLPKASWRLLACEETGVNPGRETECVGVSWHMSWSVQFSRLLSRVWLFVTPWTAAHQASLCVTNSWSLLKFMSIELVMPSNHLILSCPLLLPSIFPSIRVFSSESVLRIRRICHDT